MGESENGNSKHSVITPEIKLTGAEGSKEEIKIECYLSREECVDDPPGQTTISMETTILDLNSQHSGSESVLLDDNPHSDNTITEDCVADNNEDVPLSEGV